MAALNHLVQTVAQAAGNFTRDLLKGRYLAHAEVLGADASDDPALAPSKVVERSLGPLLGRSVVLMVDGPSESVMTISVAGQWMHISFPLRTWSDLNALFERNTRFRNPIGLVLCSDWGYDVDVIDRGAVDGLLVQAFDGEGYILAWL